MKSPAITAALTLSLTGQYERQGTEAAEGVRLWAQEAGIRLILADDHGSRSIAVDAYAGWIDGVDLLLGPYASGLVRAVAPLVRDAGRILWNHGGSADDLAQPGTASLPAPASTYFEGIVDEAIERKVRRLIVFRDQDRSHVLSPTEPRERGTERGIDSQTIDASAVETEDLDDAALLVAGPFEHDVAVVRGLRDRRPSPGAPWCRGCRNPSIRPGTRRGGRRRARAGAVVAKLTDTEDRPVRHGLRHPLPAPNRP